MQQYIRNLSHLLCNLDSTRHIVMGSCTQKPKTRRRNPIYIYPKPDPNPIQTQPKPDLTQTRLNPTRSSSQERRWMQSVLTRIFDDTIGSNDNLVKSWIRQGKELPVVRPQAKIHCKPTVMLLVRWVQSRVNLLCAATSQTDISESWSREKKIYFH